MKRQNKKILAACIVSAAVSGSHLLPAQAATEAVLAEVQVTGEKSETTVAAPVKILADPVDSRLAVPPSSSLATEKITREDIEKIHPKDIVELIQNGMGLNATRYGAKGYVKFETRGGDEIGYIIDGIYFPESQASRMLMNLPVDMIESITLVRDASILTMGPVASFAQTNVKSGNAAQGYILIKTMTPTKKVDKATASYGTFDTTKISYVHGDTFDESGYYTLGYAKDKGNGMAGWNANYDLDTYLFKAGDKGKDWIANITVLYNEGDVHNQAQFASKANSEAGIATSTLSLGGFLPIKTTAVAMNAAKQWDKNNTTDFSFGWSNVNSYRWAPNGNPVSANANAYNPGGFTENDYLRELNLGHTMDNGRDTLKFGTQLLWWHAPLGMGKYGGVERQEELYGFYLYGERKATDKVTLDAAARLDKKHITHGAAKYFGTTTGGALENSLGEMWEGNSFSTSVGAAYQINPVYKTTARIGYSQQADNEYLHAAAADGTQGDSLGDEKRMKYEAGLEAKYSKALNASLTAFYYDIDNARIVDSTHPYTDEYGYTVYSYNSKDLQRRGFELGLHGDLTDHFGYKAGYAYFASSDATDDLCSPHNRYNIELNYKNRNISANLMLHHNSHYFGTNSGESAGSGTGLCSMDEVTTIDLNINKEIDANTTLTLFGNNITDQRYTKGNLWYDTGATYGVQVSKNF